MTAVGDARKRLSEAETALSRPASPQPTNSPPDALAGAQGVEAIRAKIRATPKRSGSCCIQAGVPDHGCPERPFYGDADELELLLVALDEARAEVAENERLMIGMRNARDRAESALASVVAVCEQVEADDRESLNTFGQHLAGSVITVAEMIRAALTPTTTDETGDES